MYLSLKRINLKVKFVDTLYFDIKVIIINFFSIKNRKKTYHSITLKLNIFYLAQDTKEICFVQKNYEWKMFLIYYSEKSG